MLYDPGAVGTWPAFHLNQVLKYSTKKPVRTEQVNVDKHCCSSPKCIFRACTYCYSCVAEFLICLHCVFQLCCQLCVSTVCNVYQLVCFYCMCQLLMLKLSNTHHVLKCNYTSYQTIWLWWISVCAFFGYDLGLSLSTCELPPKGFVNCLINCWLLSLVIWRV